MKRSAPKSHCPINYSLEIIGDPWSLLILRDIICYQKHTFGEFLNSKEGISSRTLTARLQNLQSADILTRQPSSDDKRKYGYHLTAKGLALIPVLIELATWGAIYDKRTAAPQTWIQAVKNDRIFSRGSHRNRLAAFIKDR